MAWIKRTACVILFLAYIFFIFKSVRSNPYIYIAASTFLVLLWMTLKAGKSTNLKAIYVNLAVLTLAFALGEAYLAGWFSVSSASEPNQATRMEGSYTLWGSYFTTDDLRGYAGAKNAKITSKLYHGDEVIYDVIYTTNQYGLRVSPHDLKNDDLKLKKDFTNVAFFGCSFTVGQGINDNETLPYLFEEKSKGEYLTYNFGFHGYGPHQMLRILETGWLDKIMVKKGPLIAIYWALLPHIERSAGNYPYLVWDAYGPRYKLNSAGEVEYAGKFKDESMIKRFIPVLNKSLIIQKTNLLPRIWGWKRNRQDIKLFVKIIQKSQAIVADKYHGDFYVLLGLDKNDPDYEYVFAELRRNNLKVITTQEIFSKYPEAEEKYYIKGDGHPNKLANERIAEYLLKYLHPHG